MPLIVGICTLAGATIIFSWAHYLGLAGSGKVLGALLAAYWVGRAVYAIDEWRHGGGTVSHDVLIEDLHTTIATLRYENELLLAELGLRNKEPK